MTDAELTELATETFKRIDRSEAMSARSRRLKEWVVTVCCWDGVLPLAVVGLPGVLKFMFPRWNLGLALAAVFVPTLALGIRFVFGWLKLRRNGSYIWQIVLFTVAISALFLTEAFLLNDQLGNGPKIADPAIMLTLLAVYFTAMLIAFLPLRIPEADRTNYQDI